MKQNYIPVSILSAVIILVFLLNCLFLTNYSSKDEQKAAYTIEKINQINDKIIERKVIEDTYFHYLGDDADLLDDIKKYNESTGLLTDVFMVAALDIAISMYQDMDGSEIDYYAYDSFSDYLKFPAEIREFQEIIAHAALYRNCAVLLYANPNLAHFLGKGLGGSLGMWPKTLQNVDRSLNTPLRDDLAAYFDLVDGLIIKIEAYRNMLN